MIKFHCSHCGTKISAELSDAGASAPCPTCGQDLVVPAGSITSSTDHQQVESASVSKIPPNPSIQNKKAPRTGKKNMMMVGLLIVSAAVIIGVIVVAKLAKPKPGVQVTADTTKKTRAINSTSIGGRLDDFVKKYGDGDSVAVVATERMNYKYTGFSIGQNTVLVVGYDNDKIITCGVIFKHDGNKQFKVLPLDQQEIDNGLKMFSRHEGANWYESTSDDAELRTWGYVAAESSLKWGSSALMVIYARDNPYLLVVSTNSDNGSSENLMKDMQNWQVYAPNKSGTN